MHRGFAAVRIRLATAPATDPNSHVKQPTEKQIKYAESLDLDVRKDSQAVASARIDLKLVRMNEKALEQLDLKPGDRVLVRRGGPEPFEEERIVSSIGRDSKVYFKGQDGSWGAWPSQLSNLDSTA